MHFCYISQKTPYILKHHTLFRHQERHGLGGMRVVDVGRLTGGQEEGVAAPAADAAGEGHDAGARAAEGGRAYAGLPPPNGFHGKHRSQAPHVFRRRHPAVLAGGFGI